jgi:hypothetical protein
MTKTTRDQKATDAAGTIVKATEVEKHFKMCLYARNKIGKTVFACSSGLPTLVIDFNEHGFDSVTDNPLVDIYNCPRWEDVDPIFWYLRAGKHPYKVIVLDTMTMMAAIGMKWVLKDDYDRDMNKDPMTPSRPSYLKLGEMLKDSIIKFRNLPYHIIFNAQEKTSTEDDEEGNTLIETHPELSPAPRSVLLSATNVIGRMYVAEAEVKGKKVMERRILLAARPKYVAGSRFPQLRAIERLKPAPHTNLGDFITRIYGEDNARS